MKYDEYLKIFQQDLKEFILEQFEELINIAKISPPKQSKKFLNTASYRDLLRTYIYNRQKIPYGKKKVIYSKEILKSPIYKALKKKVDNIAICFTKDGNISQYLTKRIHNLEARDNLLLDWGIIHLHLYPFKERPNGNDNLLLFIYIRGNNVFFLNIGNHNSFADRYLLKIIDNNWPSLLNTLNTTDENNFTPQEIIKLRKSNICYVLTVNGKNVASFLEGLQNRMYIPLVINKLLEDIAKCMESVEEDIKNKLSKLHKQTIEKIDIHLYFDKQKQKIILYDAITKTELKFSNNEILEYLENVLRNANIF